MTKKLLTLSDRSFLNIDYQDMLSYTSFNDRLNYLSLWKYDYISPRDIGQFFYHDKEWREVREYIIARDLGYDLGCPGFQITDKVIVHHIKPILEEDLMTWNRDILFNPNNLITVSQDTHNKIHYRSQIFSVYEERYPGDTNLW